MRSSLDVFIAPSKPAVDWSYSLGAKEREDAQIALTDKFAFLKEERFSARE